MRGLGLAGLVTVEALLLVGPGCSKSGGQSPPPGDAASGGAGAVTGSGSGGAGPGTAGGAPGTGGASIPADGGADRPASVDAANDPSAASRAEQACRESMILQCTRFNACYGAEGDPAAGCDQLADRCPDYYFGPHSTRTVESVEACVAFFRQMTCTDVLMGLGGACLAGGMGMEGAPCSGASECQSRYCTGYAPVCGTCGAALPLGAACGVGTGFCTSGTVCHPGTRICVSLPLAVAHAREGEACDLSGNPPVGCEGELVCFPTVRGMSPGTCVALPTAGQHCLDTGGSGARCAAGLGCGLSTADGGRTLVCGSPPVCGTKVCAANEYCSESPTVPIHCAPYPMAGEACYFNVPEGTRSCPPGLLCTGTDVVMVDGGTGYRGTCNATVGLGEACDAVRLCRSPLVCTAGRCARFDPATCFQPVDGGQGQ